MSVLDIEDNFLKDWTVEGFKGFCHFMVNKATGERVVIPMCWGSVDRNDLEGCYCKKRKIVVDTEDDKINDYISYLESELSRLKS